MNRRNFLKTTSVLSGAGLAAGTQQLFSQLLATALNEDRVLVLIQLTGGNDGLNTLVPIDQYGGLAQVRSNIILPESSLLSLNTENALHPNMTGMQQLYQEGLLGIIQSVGYPNQNRSHFRSTDIWTSASAADVVDTTGWLGRMLAEDHPSFPEGYPSDANPDPLAIMMDNVVTATCQGMVANYSLAVRDPFNFTYIAPGGDTPIPSTPYGSELSFIRQTIAQANDYGTVVTDAANAGNSDGTLYPATRLGEQLSGIANLISGGLRTKIYVATLGGFDTHANQVSGNDTTAGDHAQLLANLSASIAAFQADIEALGLADRVLGMTFSEFGRRIRSNVSAGTDHGTAAPLFVFGNCVQGGILGTNPEIDVNVGSQDGVSMQYDFRDLYGSIMIDWFGVSDSMVRSLLYPNFVYLPIIGACAALPVEWLSFIASPSYRDIRLQWQTASETNNRGFEVERSENGRNFTRIGYVTGRGDRERITDYTFLDRSVRRGPLYYYRLRQIDIDGLERYSIIQTARLIGSSIGEWQVSLPAPNPIRNDTRIQIFAPVDSNTRYKIFDQAGRLVTSGQLYLIGGQDNQVQLHEADHLPAGMYTWKLYTPDREFTRRLMKQ